MELPNRALHSLYVIAVRRAKADEKAREEAKRQGKPEPLPSNVDMDDMKAALFGG